MRDIHSHILPGVDDGAKNLEESLKMIEAAKRAGVSSIVCTPHCRDPYFNYDSMWQSFHQLKSCANGFPLSMGFEVNHAKLMDLGMDWVQKLAYDGSSDFLLELSTKADKAQFSVYERTIFKIQSLGYQVIIAHPERYKAIQEDVMMADFLIKLGCKLQVSSDFIVGGRFGREKRPAKKLFSQNMVSYIASDAHNVKHYSYLEKALSKYKVRGMHAKRRSSNALSN